MGMTTLDGLTLTSELGKNSNLAPGDLWDRKQSTNLNVPFSQSTKLTLLFSHSTDLTDDLILKPLPERTYGKGLQFQVWQHQPDLSHKATLCHMCPAW
eukprot:3744960-Amphidinium_carterae.1